MKNLFGYIKLGRLNKRIADKISQPTADIYIEYNHLRHIEKKRGEYLKNIKLQLLTKTECYVVKTAFPKRYMASSEVLLWQK